MYEIDVLRVGNLKDADAITARFTRPDTGALAHIVVDAGWQEDGDTVVGMVNNAYRTDHVDIAILSHPDGDHIGGMGTVLRELNVDVLLIHRLDQRGGDGLPAAEAVSELVALADERGTRVVEPSPGVWAFGHALTILGPDDPYYDQLVEEQQVGAPVEKAGRVAQLAEAVRSAAGRFINRLPVEIPFDDGPGCGPRNNSSVITLLQVDGLRALFTADAGVPAITGALDYAEAAGLNALRPNLVQIAHHGSRRNASSELLDRLLGPIGQQGTGAAFVSVVSSTDPKHPAGRVVNAYRRRGYPAWWTSEKSLLWNSPDAPQRPNYSPADPLPPMEETEDDA